jgi:hypothetical protein
MARELLECILCCEDKLEATFPRLVGDSRVCDECARESVVPMFLEALEHEHEYPPMWGKEKLEFQTFCDLFEDGWEYMWLDKETEYAMPVKERLYCEHRDCVTGIVCGEFLGTRGSGLTLCSTCLRHTCRACGTSDHDAASSGEHACKKVAEVNPFEKLLKGSHYQQCPGCKKTFSQLDGCNHMTCRSPCGTNWCFICGERIAAHQSGHWQKGGCPRFGVAGSQGIWDEPDEHSEAGSDGSDDDNDLDEHREADADEPDNNNGGEIALIGHQVGAGGSNNNFGGGTSLIEHLRDLKSIGEIIDVFDHAADAERFESNRTRFITGNTSLNTEYRFRFYGYVSTNLDIVLRVKARSDSDDSPGLLKEFNERHQRINEMYRFSQDNADSKVGTVTELSDLSDQFDAYYVFALETMADLEMMADLEVTADLEMMAIESAEGH